MAGTSPRNDLFAFQKTATGVWNLMPMLAFSGMIAAGDTVDGGIT